MVMSAMRERQKKEDTDANILFRLFEYSFVDLELLVDDVGYTFRVSFPLKTCSALYVSLYVGWTCGEGEGIILRIDRGRTTSMEHDLWGKRKVDELD